jgi:hypothetical protein
VVFAPILVSVPGAVDDLNVQAAAGVVVAVVVDVVRCFRCRPHFLVETGVAQDGDFRGGRVYFRV